MEDQTVTLSPVREKNSLGPNPALATNPDRTSILTESSNGLSRSELDAARRSISVNQPKLPKELEKLSGTLRPEELTTLSLILENIKKQPAPITISEDTNKAVLAILLNIATDIDRSNTLGIRNPTAQSIAKVLAERAFDKDNGAQLAQLLMQSALQPEVVTARQLTSAPISIEEQREQLIKEVQKSAFLQAQSDFSNSPRSSLDPRTARITLHGILNRYPELQSDNQIQELMTASFQEAYKEKFNEKFAAMNIIQRGYYGFTKHWGENFSQIGSFLTKAAESTVAGVQSLGTSTISAIQSAGSAISSVAKSAYSLVTDPKTYSSIGSAISTGFNAITNYENYQYIGSSISNAFSSTISALSNSENWVSAASAVWGGIKTAGSFVAECCTNPQKLLEVTKAVGSFGYGMLETLGVIDIGRGIWKLGEGVWRAGIGQLQFGASVLSNGFQFVTGQQSFDQMTGNLSNSFNSSFAKAIECFKESTVAIKGAVIAVGEVTGISDAVRCAYYLAQGDYTNAAISGGIAAASIGAFIWSGGLSSVGVAAAKLGLKQAAKVALTQVAAEGMECLAKETAKEVFSKVITEVGEHALKEAGLSITESSLKIAGEKALSEAVERSTSNILTKGITELAESVERNGIKALVGAEAKKAVGEIFEKYAYQSTKDLLAELKVYDHVKESCRELLNTIDNKSIDGLEKKLLKSGISEETSKNTAKQLRKALKSGRSDGEMIEILTNNITDEISEQIIKRTESSFKATFTAALEGKLPAGVSDDLGEAIGKLQTAMKEKSITLSKQEIDELVDAGFDGCKRGIKRATHEVVKRAVKDAFDDYRKTNWRLIPALNANIAGSTIKEAQVPTETADAADKPLLKGIVEQATSELHSGGKLKRTSSQKNTLLNETTEFRDDDISTAA
jgi:hypothetical protein